MSNRAFFVEGRFFSPFETGYRPIAGWRWYWRFLREHPTGMALRCEADCHAALDLVWC